MTSRSIDPLQCFCASQHCLNPPRSYTLKNPAKEQSHIRRAVILRKQSKWTHPPGDIGRCNPIQVNPDLWNTQWKESQQCTAIDWVHDPELNWADYSRLCSKFDLKPNSAVKKLHRKYHQCRRTAVEQYKQWRESDGKTVDAQINLWYKQYGL